MNLFGFYVVIHTLILPEIGCFRIKRVDRDQKFELGERIAHLVLVWHGGQRVETLRDIAVNLALPHQVEIGQHVIAAIPFGQPFITPVIGSVA